MTRRAAAFFHAQLAGREVEFVMKGDDGVGFGYGLGPAILYSNKSLHFKITMNFGLGMLLGKEVKFR